MQIIELFKETDAKGKYALTRSPLIEKMSDHIGESVQVKNYCLYEDVDSNGEIKTLLSVLSADGKIYATVSKTFQKEFDAIKVIVSEDELSEFTIEIVGGKSKAGREFVTCALV